MLPGRWLSATQARRRLFPPSPDPAASKSGSGTRGRAREQKRGAGGGSRERAEPARANAGRGAFGGGSVGRAGGASEGSRLAGARRPRGDRGLVFESEPLCKLAIGEEQELVFGRM